jgi:hypothetical protein
VEELRRLEDLRRSGNEMRRHGIIVLQMGKVPTDTPPLQKGIKEIDSGSKRN